MLSNLTTSTLLQTLIILCLDLRGHMPSCATDRVCVCTDFLIILRLEFLGNIEIDNLKNTIVSAKHIVQF